MECPKCADTIRTQQGMQKELHEVEQVLGKALGYPAYADDQKNFPGATEKDGVCVGENTPGTLAMEAAEKLRKFREKLKFAMDLISFAETQERLDLYWHSCDVPEPAHVCGHCVFLREVKELIDE